MIHSYNNELNDSLIILKNNTKVATHEEMLHSLFLNKDGIWAPYFYDEFVFDGSDFTILDRFIGKLKYAYASLHEDAFVTAVLKELVPEVVDVELPNRRYTRTANLQIWMQEYNFSLKEFLTLSKYVVCPDYYNARIFTKLNDLGLVNWDDIEKASSFDE